MKRGEVAILAGPQQQVEVVGHQAVGQQSHVEAGDGLLQDPLERGIVVIIVEDSQSGISPVQGMVDQAAFRRHVVVLAYPDDNGGSRMSRTAPDPFLSPASRTESNSA